MLSDKTVPRYRSSRSAMDSLPVEPLRRGYPNKLKADQAQNRRNQIAQTMGRKIVPRNRH